MANKNFGKSKKLFNKALFLDRDGVINIERGNFTWQIADFKLMPGIVKLTKKAQESGYALIVITNQSGIARGIYGHEEVQTLHRYMIDLFEKEGVSFQGIYYCPHHPEFTGACFCRKPEPLMIERAAALLQVNPSDSFMLGDKKRDLEAGRKCGCKTVAIGKMDDFEADFSFQTPDELIPFL